MFATRGTVCAPTAAILLSACDSGGGGAGSSDSSTMNTATGVSKDASVTGFEYRSGNPSGTTGDNGEFTFEVGESITFSVGGVTTGTTEGAEVITLVDLGAGNTVAFRGIVKRVRFLLFLESNDDPDNGIEISDDVRDVADNWNSVDFTSGDLGNELIAIAIDIHGTDAAGIAHTVVTGKTQRITGAISNGTDLDATTADSTAILATPVNSRTGATQLNGTWNEGPFSGDGCRLN